MNKTILTLPNIVTIIRFVLVPVWLIWAELAISAEFLSFSWMRLGVMFFFALLALTDKLDGYLARSRNQVSDFGKFLDPLADKLLVAVPLMYLLQVGLVDIWVPTIILAREFLVSGLRMTVASQGVVIAASNLGKWKTATTLVGIAGLLLAYSISPATGIYSMVFLVSWGWLMAGALLTLVSGVDYAWKSKSYF